MLWCPKQHTVLKVRPQQRRADQDNPFPRPAGSAVPDAPQDMVGPPGCQGTLLTHIQLAVDQNPQIPFLSAAFQPLTRQSNFGFGFWSFLNKFVL